MYFLFERTPINRKPGRILERCLNKPKDIRPLAAQIITSPPEGPVEFLLEPLDPNNTVESGPYLPAILDECSWPVMRIDLVEALQAAGVDNLQAFDALVHDPDNGQTYTEYQWVNFVGLMATADMGKSEGESLTGGEPLLDVFFTKLVLDPSKTHTFLMYRMAEAPSNILVHHSVKEYLEKNYPYVDDLTFWDLGNVAVG